MPPVFVDTSAWCALFNRQDDHHDWAKALWDRVVREKTRLATSDYVLDETLTLLRSRIHFAAAKEAGEKLFASAILRRIHLSEREFLLAWEWFKKYKDHEFSFTDCTSFALMRENKIDQVWTLDGDFAKAGFELAT